MLMHSVSSATVSYYFFKRSPNPSVLTVGIWNKLNDQQAFVRLILSKNVQTDKVAKIVIKRIIVLTAATRTTSSLLI